MARAAATSEAISAAGMTIQFLVEPDESNGAVSVFRCDLPVGSHNPAPHSHDGFDETVYGLSGVTTHGQRRSHQDRRGRRPVHPTRRGPRLRRRRG
jgi:quercetin dioxygenase-like cupin family protein